MPVLWTVDWWASVLVSALFSSGFVGFLGWLFKKQIEHWFARGLEAEKARHAKDLESYRTSLIAAAEASKANVEVRKSAAMFVARKEYEALHDLYSSISGVATDFGAASREHILNGAELTPDQRLFFTTRARKIADAGDSANLFLSHDERVEISMVGSLLSTFYQEIINADQRPVSPANIKMRDMVYGDRAKEIADLADMTPEDRWDSAWKMLAEREKNAESVLRTKLNGFRNSLI